MALLLKLLARPSTRRLIELADLQRAELAEARGGDPCSRDPDAQAIAVPALERRQISTRRHPPRWERHRLCVTGGILHFRQHGAAFAAPLLIFLGPSRQHVLEAERVGGFRCDDSSTFTVLFKAASIACWSAT